MPPGPVTATARRMDPRPAAVTPPSRSGLALGVSAYTMWGLIPIYFKLLVGVPALIIVAHRILWSLVLIGGLLSLVGAWSAVRDACRHPATLRLLTLCALLIGSNWLLYVYAVNSGNILASSLGYYLNPLANILLGRFVLKEPLSRTQWLAVAIAAAGVAIMAVGALDQLWISLALCGTFAAYGLLRKVARVDAAAGLGIETAFLFLPALLYLLFAAKAGQPVWGLDQADTIFLLLCGAVSTIPLLLFTAAARRLPYSTLGILQFIAPTLQFLGAVFLFGEAFTTAHAWAFGFIWTAAILYLWSALQTRREQPKP